MICLLTFEQKTRMMIAVLRYRVPKKETSPCESSSSTVLFPTNKCLLFKKETLKGLKRLLTKCVTKCSVDSVKEAVIVKYDSELLGEI